MGRKPNPNKRKQPEEIVVAYDGLKDLITLVAALIAQHDQMIEWDLRNRPKATQALYEIRELADALIWKAMRWLYAEDNVRFRSKKARWNYLAQLAAERDLHIHLFGREQEWEDDEE
jgi:hypothetical protein